MQTASSGTKWTMNLCNARLAVRPKNVACSVAAALRFAQSPPPARFLTVVWYGMMWYLW